MDHTHIVAAVTTTLSSMILLLPIVFPPSCQCPVASHHVNIVWLPYNNCAEISASPGDRHSIDDVSNLKQPHVQTNSFGTHASLLSLDTNVFGILSRTYGEINFTDSSLDSSGRPRPPTNAPRSRFGHAVVRARIMQLDSRLDSARAQSDALVHNAARGLSSATGSGIGGELELRGVRR
jgi:hypothetical protein